MNERRKECWIGVNGITNFNRLTASPLLNNTSNSHSLFVLITHHLPNQVHPSSVHSSHSSHPTTTPLRPFKAFLYTLSQSVLTAPRHRHTHMPPSTPSPPSREDGNVEANKETSRSQQTHTGNSSPVNKASEVLEKPESENNSLAAEEQRVEPPAPPPMTYPKGLQLVGIMASLVLTIGMMSLDSVSSNSPAS